MLTNRVFAHKSPGTPMAKYLPQNFCHAAGCILPVYADNEPRCDSARNAQNDASGKDIAYKSDSGWIVYDRLFAEYLRTLQ